MSHTVGELNQRWGDNIDGVGCDNFALGGIYVTDLGECGALLFFTVQ